MIEVKNFRRDFVVVLLEHFDGGLTWQYMDDTNVRFEKNIVVLIL